MKTIATLPTLNLVNSTNNISMLRELKSQALTIKTLLGSEELFTKFKTAPELLEVYTALEICELRSHARSIVNIIEIRLRNLGVAL